MGQVGGGEWGVQECLRDEVTRNIIHYFWCSLYSIRRAVREGVSFSLLCLYSSGLVFVEKVVCRSLYCVYIASERWPFVSFIGRQQITHTSAAHTIVLDFLDG